MDRGASSNKHVVLQATGSSPRRKRSSLYLAAFSIRGLRGSFVSRVPPVTAHVLLGKTWASCPPQARQQGKHRVVAPKGVDSGAISDTRDHSKSIISREPQLHPLDGHSAPLERPLEDRGAHSIATQSISVLEFSSLLSMKRALNGVRFPVLFLALCFFIFYFWVAGIFTHKSS